MLLQKERDRFSGLVFLYLPMVSAIKQDYYFKGMSIIRIILRHWNQLSATPSYVGPNPFVLAES
ncbi:hypothetical protein [Paenibacillus sp. FSL H8-0034]|uniref:hypothetical protein n=1 Tax=Paenibacillus sp. FSL H8-0034 TaxID=2954671 RepID=UPI0030FA664B